MFTYSQLKKNICVTLPPPRGSMATFYVPKMYASSGIDISKCIEGGSMKLTTLVDYYIHYMCVVTKSFPCNECILKNIFKPFLGGFS